MAKTKLELLDLFQSAHDAYFRLLMQDYPSERNEEIGSDFGTPELCELATEAHACAISLGSKALQRLNFVGFSDLYAFDNPVDMYNWRVKVRKDKINHTTYASIAIRIDSELKRLRRIAEFGGEAAYEALEVDELLVSKVRYQSLAGSHEKADSPAQGVSGSTVNIHTINMNHSTDSQAVGKLEEYEKRTTIWSNVSNIINVLRSLVGG